MSDRIPICFECKPREDYRGDFLGTLVCPHHDSVSTLRSEVERLKAQVESAFKAGVEDAAQLSAIAKERDEAMGLQSSLYHDASVLKGKLEAAESESTRLRKELADSKESAYNWRLGNEKCLAELTRLREREKALVGALKNAAHWFNEQMRLYKDASQSLVARNFQIENFALAGFKACFAALSPAEPSGDAKKGAALSAEPEGKESKRG